MGSTRTNADGFKGQYPPNSTVFDQAYYDLGLTPPWLLEYVDGKVVGDRGTAEEPAPRHEA